MSHCLGEDERGGSEPWQHMVHLSLWNNHRRASAVESPPQSVKQLLPTSGGGRLKKHGAPTATQPKQQQQHSDSNASECAAPTLQEPRPAPLGPRRQPKRIDEPSIVEAHHRVADLRATRSTLVVRCPRTAVRAPSFACRIVQGRRPCATPYGVHPKSVPRVPGSGETLSAPKRPLATKAGVVPTSDFLENAAVFSETRGYEYVRQIGTGSFGKAFLVRDRDNGKHYVAKMVDMTRLGEREKRDAVNEVQVLSSLKHPYIISYKESFTSGSFLCIVMDYADGGDLFQAIARQKKRGTFFPETQILRWFTQATLALKYLHEKHILHRDLKTQNLFLMENGRLRLGDFGIAKALDRTAAFTKTQIGTPYYLSPEICKNQPYSWAADIWSLGCILYELSTFKVPFDAPNISVLLNKITHQTAPALPETFSPALRQLCADCFQQEWQKRPSAVEILQREIVQAEIRRMLLEEQAKRRRPIGVSSRHIHNVPRAASALNTILSKGTQTLHGLPRGFGPSLSHDLNHPGRREALKLKGVRKDAPISGLSGKVNAVSPHVQVALREEKPLVGLSDPTHRQSSCHSQCGVASPTARDPRGKVRCHGSPGGQSFSVSEMQHQTRAIPRSLAVAQSTLHNNPPASGRGAVNSSSELNSVVAASPEKKSVCVYCENLKLQENAAKLSVREMVQGKPSMLKATPVTSSMSLLAEKPPTLGVPASFERRCHQTPSLGISLQKAHHAFWSQSTTADEYPQGSAGSPFASPLKNANPQTPGLKAYGAFPSDAL